MFNSLKYAKKLEEVGLPREQAEMHLQIISEIMESSLATKQDIKDLKNEVQAEIREVKLTLQAEIKMCEQRMTIKLGSIVSIAIGVAVTLVKLIS